VIAHDAHNRQADLIYRLRALGMAGTILHIGAHPDDEDVGLMAYAARKLGVRIVYWSATRGEGGQNRLGPHTQESLGIYRSWESLDVRRVDGGEARFGPFYDFGYSKTGEETLAKWGGRHDVTREVVRAIRSVQPQIVIGRWTGDPESDGHGHHQAIGLVTAAAFEAAGDPSAFPELRADGLAPWRPEKLFFSTGGDWQPGEDEGDVGGARPEFEAAGFVRIDSGEFDPIANRTYQEQAWIGFNNHRTQAMGFVPEKTPFFYYYAPAEGAGAGDIGAPVGFHDGSDPTLVGLADYPGDGSPSLRAGLEEVSAIAETAFARYRPDRPDETGPSVLDAASLLRRLGEGVIDAGLDDDRESALATYLERKAVEFEEVAGRCLGLELECLADTAQLMPGRQVRVRARLWNPKDIPITAGPFSFRRPDGWRVRSLDPVGRDDHDEAADFEMTVPLDADLACPYWLKTPREQYRYHWPAGELAGRPFDEPLVEVECRISVGTHEFTMRAAVIAREGYAGGFRELPVAVVPPISLHPERQRDILPVSESDQHLELRAVASRDPELAEVEGILRLEVPSGWEVEPRHIPLELGSTAESHTVRFAVTIPADAPAGVHRLRYVVRCGSRDYDVVLHPVRMGGPGHRGSVDASSCVREQFVTSPAVDDVHLIDTTFVPGLSYGYVRGAAEPVVEALSRFGLDVEVLGDDEISYADLERFDAIIVGPNAYLMNTALKNNAARFSAYVEQGGTLIVQYQGYDYGAAEYAPYPWRFHQPHDRVTREDAPVTILEPDHFLFHQPNEITDADFDGWVHDRGMYFMGEWDHRYLPLLACHDPGEDPRAGGLLVTAHGRGTFVYAAYSFFRQLPAGVPGAFRLFANILAVPAATLLARARILRQVSLFASMDDLQLQQVARILSERWVAGGDHLCHQGDEGDEMYLVVSGEVEIVRAVAGKPDQVVYRAKAGDAIGEFQVLGTATRTASMRARGEVHLLVMEGSHFRELMHQDPDMSDRVIRLLVDKLASAGEET
jgi:LmbE family N-acetylglucosaminyl deacetylase